jgi:hypothetical protein
MRYNVQQFSSYCDEDRHDSCMSLVPSSKGGCDCNCHAFNSEENKKFDNSGKVLAKFDVKYIGGHQAYPNGQDTQAFFFTDGLEINNPEISIPYSCITHVEGMEQQRITKTRVFMTGILTGLLWKKNYLYTVIDYIDENEEETIVLDFHTSAEKAQGLIYQKMIAAKKHSNYKPAKESFANEE